MPKVPKALDALIADVTVGAVDFGRLGYYYRFIAAMETGVYCVQPGDTLSGIARYTGTNWPELAVLNNIQNANYVHPGQIIKLR